MSAGNEREFIDHLQNKEKGGKTMYCPLIGLDEQNRAWAQKAIQTCCLKEDCAWWDKTYERCDPTGLAHTLERLTDELAEIERKMPYKEQYRK